MLDLQAFGHQAAHLAIVSEPADLQWDPPAMVEPVAAAAAAVADLEYSGFGRGGQDRGWGQPQDFAGHTRDMPGRDWHMDWDKPGMPGKWC